MHGAGGVGFSKKRGRRPALRACKAACRFELLQNNFGQYLDFCRRALCLLKGGLQTVDVCRPLLDCGPRLGDGQLLRGGADMVDDGGKLVPLQGQEPTCRRRDVARQFPLLRQLVPHLQVVDVVIGQHALLIKGLDLRGRQGHLTVPCRLKKLSYSLRVANKGFSLLDRSARNFQLALCLLCLRLRRG